jgi:hypothetical protein
VKDIPHPLELPGNMAGLLFAGIGQHDEVRAADLNPGLSRVSAKCARGGHHKSEQQEPFPADHVWNHYSENHRSRLNFDAHEQY